MSSIDPRVHPAVALRRIGVCGSSRIEDPAAEAFCRDLGRALATDPTPILVSGGCHYRSDPKRQKEGPPSRLSADWYVIESAELALGGPNAPVVSSRIETMLPDPANEQKDTDKSIVKFRKGHVVVYPHSTPQARRFRFVSSVDVLVAVGGGTGTEQNLQLAFALGVPTLPMPQFAEEKTRPLCTQNGEQVQRWFGISPREWREWTQTSAQALSLDDIQTLARRCARLLIERLKLPCFVIMPFRPEYEAIFTKAIKPAVEAAGLLPVRTDKLNAPGEILATIRSGIESCACAVAVITGLKPNVMYELGLAHAHGKPVVILMEGSAEEIDRLAPFDVKTHAVLSYTAADTDLQDRIRRALEETRSTLIAPSYLSFSPPKLDDES